jgi:aspartokinase-like uncharacterized kinase
VPNIWVVKLGGSLTKSPLLKAWLDRISQHKQAKVVIVAGGGGFADQVRIVQKQWNFQDQNAHQMAILAMQQMALLFQGIQPQLQLASSLLKINSSLKVGKAVVWVPEVEMLNKAGIPASWDITSDSLAAWLAEQLSATRLILVKSALISRQYSIEEFIQMGVVDKAFTQYANRLNAQIMVVNREYIDSFSF